MEDSPRCRHWLSASFSEGNNSRAKSIKQASHENLYGSGDLIDFYEELLELEKKNRSTDSKKRGCTSGGPGGGLGARTKKAPKMADIMDASDFKESNFLNVENDDPMFPDGHSHRARVRRQSNFPAIDETVPKVYDFNNLSMSFSGCGFLGIYHLGVAAALQHFVPGHQFRKVCGASAGALAAAGLLAGVEIGKLVKEMVVASLHARQLMLGPFNPNYDVCEAVERSLNDLFPDNIHDLVRDRLYISLTDINTGGNVIAYNFEDKRDLISAIVASAYIPIFSGLWPYTYRTHYVLDGGFSSNMPTLFPNTISVTPFAGEATICPLDDKKNRKYQIPVTYLAQQGYELSLYNIRRLTKTLYPPPIDNLKEILHDGFKDAHRFLRQHGVIPCFNCIAVTTRLHPEDESHVCEDSVDCDVYAKDTVELPSYLDVMFRRWKLAFTKESTLVPVVIDGFTKSVDATEYITRALSLLRSIIVQSPVAWISRAIYNRLTPLHYILREFTPLILDVSELPKEDWADFDKTVGHFFQRYIVDTASSKSFGFVKYITSKIGLRFEMSKSYVSPEKVQVIKPPIHAFHAQPKKDSRMYELEFRDPMMAYDMVEGLGGSSGNTAGRAAAEADKDENKEHYHTTVSIQILSIQDNNENGNGEEGESGEGRTLGFGMGLTTHEKEPYDNDFQTDPYYHGYDEGQSQRPIFAEVGDASVQPRDHHLTYPVNPAELEEELINIQARTRTRGRFPEEPSSTLDARSIEADALYRAVLSGRCSVSVSQAVSRAASRVASTVASRAESPARSRSEKLNVQIPLSSSLSSSFGSSVTCASEGDLTFEDEISVTCATEGVDSVDNYSMNNYFSFNLDKSDDTVEPKSGDNYSRQQPSENRDNYEHKNRDNYTKIRDHKVKQIGLFDLRRFVDPDDEICESFEDQSRLHLRRWRPLSPDREYPVVPTPKIRPLPEVGEREYRRVCKRNTYCARVIIRPLAPEDPAFTEVDPAQIVTIFTCGCDKEIFERIGQIYPMREFVDVTPSYPWKTGTLHRFVRELRMDGY